MRKYLFLFHFILFFSQFLLMYFVRSFAVRCVLHLMHPHLLYATISEKNETKENEISEKRMNRNEMELPVIRNSLLQLPQLQ